MNLNRKQLTIAVMLLIAAQIACAPTGAAEPEKHAQEVERHLAAMGTSLTVFVKADTRAEGLAASERAVRAIEAVEARLSTWRADSELSLVNAAPAQRSARISPELAADLGRAEEIWRQTDGYFDPALGPLVQAWDLRGSGHIPGELEREAAQDASGWHHFALTGDQLIRDDARARIEEGGFGKGVALDAALAAAVAEGVTSFAAELGGQWIVQHAEDAPFEMGVAHPVHREQSLLRLNLTAGSAATSGNSERGFVINGEKVGHILSAKTGAPAHDFGSLTVVAQNAVKADCLSTALFVMGPDAALVWATQHTDIEIIIVELVEGKVRVRATAGLSGQLTALSGDLEIEFTSPLVTPIGQ